MSHLHIPAMETLACRSPRACAACPHSTRQGACMLEEQVDLTLEAMTPKPIMVVARRALA